MPAILRHLREAGRASTAAAAALVYPARCPGCGGASDPVTPGTAHLCPACLTWLARQHARPACPTCGGTLGAWETAHLPCLDCRSHGALADALVRLGTYEGPLRRMIHEHKYRNVHAVTSLLARLLAAPIEGAGWLARIDVLIPVSGHLGRWELRRQRPIDLLAERVGVLTGIPAASLLLRERGRPSQVGLTDAGQRRRNVRGAFRLARGGCEIVAGRCVGLIEDVCTTGSTLREVGRLLREAGAAAIHVALVARAQAPGDGA